MENNYSNSFLFNLKDSRWLTIEVCREYQRGQCDRKEDECKFAHVANHHRLEINDGRVVCCFDFLKNRCHRGKDRRCRYFHPPRHLCEQLLQNGRNNILMKNIRFEMIQQYLNVANTANTYQSVNPTATNNVPNVSVTQPQKVSIAPSYIAAYNMGYNHPVSPYSANQLNIIPQYSPLSDSKLLNISSPTNYSHSSGDLSPPIEDFVPLAMLNSNCFSYSKDQKCNNLSLNIPNLMDTAEMDNQLASRLTLDKNFQWFPKTGCYPACVVGRVSGVLLNQNHSTSFGMPQSCKELLYIIES